MSPASSADPWGDEIPPVGSYHARSQSTDAPPVTSLPEAHAQENIVTVESPQGRSIFKKWLQGMGVKGPASHKPDRRPGKSREPADRRFLSHSPARVDEGPSRMAAGQPTPVNAVP